MNYIDLFSGIGGFACGAYWAGMKFDKHYFSEVDPYCVELYQKRFPDAIPLGDIKEIDCEKLADADGARLERRDGEGLQERSYERPVRPSDTSWCITGGFPCQDISVAGKGEGISGRRSGLWSEYWRIIREIRPRFAIIENVGALVNRGLDTVLSNLAEIGYDAEWQDIRAEDVGAPHRRERIWIVAYPVRDGRREKRTRQSTAPSKDMADTACKRLDRSGDARPAGRQKHSDRGSRNDRRILRENGRNDGCTQSELGGCLDGLHAWMDGWEDGIPRLATKVPHRVDRLRGIGNSIVPQIAELLFRQIKECL